MMGGMPAFPAEGYITCLNGRLVVVKIAEYQDDSGNSLYGLSDLP